MLRILHAGDAHLASPFALADANRAAALRYALRASFDALCRTAAESHADLVLLAGDIYEAEYLSRDDADMILAGLSSIPCPVVVAPGNHDPAAESSLWLRDDLPANVFVFREETVAKFSFDELGADVYGYAMTGDAMERCPLDGFTVPDDGRIHLICAHADLGASRSVYAPITAEAVLRTGADYAALGHIHNPAEPVFAPHGRAAVAESGCLMGRAPDEPGDKGALLVTVGDGTVQIEKLILGALAFREADLPVSGMTAAWQVEKALRALLEEKGYTDRDLVRIRLTGSVSPELFFSTEALASAETGCRSLEIVDATTPAPSASLENDPAVRGIFYRLLKERLTSPDEKERETAERALRYGLLALGGERPAD